MLYLDACGRSAAEPSSSDFDSYRRAPAHGAVLGEINSNPTSVQQPRKLSPSDWESTEKGGLGLIQGMFGVGMIVGTFWRFL